MADKPAPHRSPCADVAPALARYTDEVLFGDLWKRAVSRPVIAASSPNELPFHIKRALDNGVKSPSPLGRSGWRLDCRASG